MSILKDELALPAYAGLTDAEAADLLNLPNIQRNKTSMSGVELLEAQWSTEFAALTDAKKAQWLALCGLSSVDPFGVAVEIVKDIWGNSSITVSNLAAARVEIISRATELSITVSLGQVQAERN